MTGMLYDLPGHKTRAMEHSTGAINAASRMQAGSTTTTEGPNDSGALLGGALYGGVGLALGLSTTPVGWAIALGLGSNFL